MAYRSSTHATAFSTSPLGTAPSGLTAGDRLLMFFTAPTEQDVKCVPIDNRWKRIGVVSSPFVDGTTNGAVCHVYEIKNANAGEQYAFTTLAASVSWIVQVVAFSGRSNYNDSIVVGTYNTTNGSSPVTITLTGVTALSGDDLCSFIVTDETVSTDQWSFTPPGTMTERQDAVGSGLNCATLQSADNVSAGATGNLVTTATITSGTGQTAWNGFVIAIPKATDATITAKPTDQIAFSESTATFSVTATGTGGLSYQWQDDSLGYWSNISGATSSSYTTPTLDYSYHKRRYRVVVTSSLDSVLSLDAELQVLQLKKLPTSSKAYAKNNTYDFDGKGWFHADTYAKGLFDSDLIDYPTGSSDVTVAIGGSSATVSRGTLGVTVDKEFAGQSSILGQGNVSSLLSNTLSGQSASSGIGTLSVSVDKSFAGQSVTNSQGNIAGASSIGITGNASTLSIGNLPPAIDKAFTGQSSSTQIGTLSVSVDKALTGQSATLSAGTITGSIDTIVALTGQEISSGIGSLNVSVDKAFTGQSATLSTGTMTADVGTTVTLTGQSSTLSYGNLSVAIDKAFSGQSTTLSTGNLSLDVSKSLTGSSSTTEQGLESSLADNVLTGQELTLGQGNVTASSTSTDVNVALTGQSIASSQGSLSVSIDKAFTGQSLTLSTGTLSSLADKSLSGQQATLSIGAVGQNVSVPLTGIQTIISQGNITGSIATIAQLAGVQSTVSKGLMTASSEAYATGLSSQIDSGQFIPLSSIGITGQQSTLAKGLIDGGAGISGNYATIDQGFLLTDISLAIAGLSANVLQGSLSHPVIPLYVLNPDDRVLLSVKKSEYLYSSIQVWP